MQKLLNRFTSVMAATTLSVGFLLSGCARNATEEEMRQLNDLRAEVASLEQQVNAKEQEKSDLERQVADARAKLQECKDDKETVRGL